MSEINAELVRKLRESTGSPMMDCKKALTEAQGDFEKAKEVLRLKGLKTAEQKVGRATAQGMVGVYLHHDKKRAAMVEVDCETDFVARNEKFIEFSNNLAKHVMAMRPGYVSRAEIPEELRKKEESLVMAESAEELSKKPEAARAKIIEGRMKKYFQQHCLLDQNFVLDETRTVESMLKDLIATLGENIRVQRFSRIEIGD